MDSQDRASSPRVTLPRALGPLELLRELQRSLEPRVVIEIFAQRMHQHYEVKGLAFEHADFGHHWGEQGEPAFATALDFDGAHFGQLALHRPRRFARCEREEIVSLAELLLHPLRNAIAHAELHKQVCEDGLTGLFNRQALDRMLPRELAAATRSGKTASLVMIDVDCLKQINDTGGHCAGDHALCCLAKAIAGSLRQSDLAFRVSGDEFILVLPDTDSASAAKVVRRIQRRLLLEAAHCARITGADILAAPLTFSAGIAASTPGITSEQLTRQADQAMYRAKKAGRNRAAEAPAHREEDPRDFPGARLAATMSEA